MLDHKVNETEEDDSTLTEDVEGLDDDSKLDGDYPIDEFLIRTENRSVFEIVRLMNRENSPYIQPEFQRDFLWKVEKQSRLIESAILRIPLPVFYLAEREDGKIAIVDGLQRLTTFHRYLNGEFALRGVANESLVGKKFKDLPSRFQDRIESTNLIMYVLDDGVPERARLEIFERVNGGVPLTRQQMRNALFHGQATRWLRKQADSEHFLEATTKSLNRKTMRDREFVNRFSAFYLLGHKAYRWRYWGEMDRFLADALRRMNGETLVSLERLEEKFPILDLQFNKNMTLDELEEKFQLSMQRNFELFGRYAFRRHSRIDKESNGYRSVINAALFDVWSVMLAREPEPLTDYRKEQLTNIFYRLLADDQFVDAIRISTNDGGQVEQRFEMAEKALQQGW